MDKFARFFNTAGPVVAEDHYYVPSLTRFDLDDVLMLLQQKRYFVLHAPRQVGKTSYLLALAKYLNAEGTYRALYMNVETGQAMRENVDAAVRAILSELSSRARDYLDDPFPLQIMEEVLEQAGGAGAFNELLTRWSRQSEKPLVLFIDEIDSLVGDTLISVLRQLRSGYDKRPSSFPHSIILCGVRDVRDYRIQSSSEQGGVLGGSAFNIKSESLRLDDFTRDEVEMLLSQHSEETGQIFTDAARERIWSLTSGQPWLVNALAYETCFKAKSGRDRAVDITDTMIDNAKENLILRRETHLDQLVDKLKEARVQRVIEPILVGDNHPETLRTDDIQYVRDLGLIQSNGHIQIANKIYQEIIPRELTYSTQATISHETAWYIAPDGRLDMKKLLIDFQQFFREHSEQWVERFAYKEAGPHLLLQAFLQRIINGGERIDREYGLGRRRTDLLIRWPYADDMPPQKMVLELKIRYGNVETTIEKGLAQTWFYMDRANTSEGHLVIFDRDVDKGWAEKIFCRMEQYEGVPIWVWGL